jgi:hypothetical protein
MQAKIGRKNSTKRRRSGSFFISGNNITKTLLEEINEELPVNNEKVIKPKEVDFIKN